LLNTTRGPPPTGRLSVWTVWLLILRLLMLMMMNRCQLLTVI